VQKPDANNIRAGNNPAFIQYYNNKYQALIVYGRLNPANFGKILWLLHFSGKKVSEIRFGAGPIMNFSGC
jgi:(2Fe-2S) ferredoxin